MKVIQVYRKKDPRFFSIENVFRLVNLGLTGRTELQTVSLPDSGFTFGNLIFLLKLRFSEKKAVFHVTGDCYYATWMLPKRKVIVTYHDCGFVAEGGRFKRALLRLLYVVWPVTHAAIVTAISEKSKQELIALTACRPGKIRVINNPVSDLIRYVPRKFSKGKPQLLFIGVTPNKNLDRVIPALEGVSCRLLLIGRIDEHIKNRLQASGIDFRNEFGLSDNQMAEKYIESDIVLFPSLYEGFGLPILEGFKAGRAVLTSDISPMKDIAGNAACLVDPHDVQAIKSGILTLSEDDSYREKLISKGFETVRNYDTAVISEQYLDLYKEIYN